MATAVPVVKTRVFGTIARQQTFRDAGLIEIRYPPHTVLPRHAHVSPLFLLTVAGAFEETVAQRSRTCGPRRLIYRPAGEEHSQQFSSVGATCLAIELPDTRASETGLAADGVELDGIHTLLAMRLYDEFRRPTTETSLVVEETVATLAAAGRALTRIDAEASTAWLDRVVDMIEARLSTPIRLSELAVEAGRHPVHVSRCFQRRFGCDVSEFVRRRRVHEACRRIRDTTDSLSAIAASTGFSDQSHLGRAFRAVMGTSPGAYRRR